MIRGRGSNAKGGCRGNLGKTRPHRGTLNGRGKVKTLKGHAMNFCKFHPREPLGAWHGKKKLLKSRHVKEKSRHMEREKMGSATMDSEQEGKRRKFDFAHRVARETQKCSTALDRGMRAKFAVKEKSTYRSIYQQRSREGRKITVEKGEQRRPRERMAKNTYQGMASGNEFRGQSGEIDIWSPSKGGD